MKRMTKYWWLLLLLPLSLTLYIAYWYLQSPVAAGVYPARLGGVIFVDSGFEMPVIWVRPHPFARKPKPFSIVVLETADGPVGRMPGTVHPNVSWPHFRPTHVWRYPRVVQGSVSFRLAQDDVVVTGVRWQVDGEPEVAYENGTYRLVRIEYGSPPNLEVAGMVPQWHYPGGEPGKRPYDMSRLDGVYVSTQGHGRVLDVISPMPGAVHPVEGLLWRNWDSEAVQGLNRTYYQDPGWQPLTLPIDLGEPALIYIPATDEGRARLQDTYFHLRPALVIATSDGPLIRPSQAGMYGILADRSKSRFWVPYYVYEPK